LPACMANLADGPMVADRQGNCHVPSVIFSP
jgi:hypothetical protein